MCLVTSLWQSAVPRCGLTGFKKLALFAFCGILVGGWDGCESDGFWSSQEPLSCYGCSKAEVMAVFLLPPWEQTWIAILFQDAPSGISTGPACWNFTAQAVPRKAATKERVQKQWAFLTEGWVHVTHFGASSGAQILWGRVLLHSPMATDWFGPGLIFCKVIYLTCAKWRLLELFPAHCTWSLGHFLTTKSCLLSPADVFQPQTLPGQGMWWQLMHSMWSLWWLCLVKPHSGGFCRDLTRPSGRRGGSWKDMFEFLPFSIFWKQLKAAPSSPRLRGPCLAFGLLAPHNESF